MHANKEIRISGVLPGNDPHRHHHINALLEEDDEVAVIRRYVDTLIRSVDTVGRSIRSIRSFVRLNILSYRNDNIFFL